MGDGPTVAAAAARRSDTTRSDRSSLREIAGHGAIDDRQGATGNEHAAAAPRSSVASLPSIATSASIAADTSVPSSARSTRK
jgi:hypothetical protein